MNDIEYVPSPRVFLPKQQKVLNAINRYKYILYSGAFGAGKTLLMSHVVIRECINHPRSLWFFGSQTVPMLRDTVVRTFMEEIDLYQQELDKRDINLKLKKQWLSHTMTFKFFNDSEILFRSCDEPSKFKSLNLEGFAIDEPVDVDEEVFLMLQGRLRGRHTGHQIGVMAGNPAGRMNWVYQKFFENPSPEYYVVHTTTYDNTYLPPDYIPSMEASFDEDYAKRYLKGEWGSFEGMVYKDFSHEQHVGSFQDKEYKYYICGIDDGTRNPCCMLTLGVDADNHVYIVDELYETGLVDTEKVEELYERHKKYNYKRVYVDPSALNLIESIKQRRIRVDGADNDLNSGISKIKSLFKNNMIHIDKTCVNFLKEVESYRYMKDKNVTRKNLTEEPIKKNDHAMDAVRYAVTDFNPFKVPTFVGFGKW